MAGLERGYAATRYGRIHYRRGGRGPALLLLHATPRSSRAYLGLMPYLAARYHVVAPDTLGFGHSDPLPAEPTVAMLADSLVDVLDHLGIVQTGVFGLHTGNKIGAALAAAHPERVGRFILCGMTHSIIPDARQREAAIRAILAAHPIDPAAVVVPSERQDRRDGAAGTRAIYQANYSFDLAAVLGRLRMPTLVLELATPAEAHLGPQADALAALIPAGTACLLERSDRDVLERVPAELAAVITRFLATARASRSAGADPAEGRESRSHIR